MTTRLILLLAAALLWAAPAAGQTVKSLGYNTTNGQVITATNVVWTNAFSFSTNTVAAQVRTNLALGETNDVTFKNITIADQTLTLSHGSEDDVFVRNDSGNLELESPVEIIAFSQISFNDTAHAAATRANLGLGLPALTNASNVTTMRALAGSTNTNEPFSGSIALTNTNTLVFSNGILLSQ